MPLPRSVVTSIRIVQAGLVSAALLLAPGTSLGATPTSASTAPSTQVAPKAQPRVVASTSWVAAFAKAAGIQDVALVAPANLQHPPDYDPKPSDLAAIAQADYVLVAGFEGFAQRMKEASGSRAEVINVRVDNQPANIKKQVMALAEKFGTQQAAAAWIARFDQRVAALEKEIAAAVPKPAPRVVAQFWMAYWVPFASMELVGTYGPRPVTASELAKLSALKPDVVIINAHVQGGNLFNDLPAKKIVLHNFPPANNIDLIAIFEGNARAIIEAMKAPKP
ncbi:MAG: ABC transporter substrate-binding protein [Brachymonas sp.]|nr:ABC transporter substrate-binding protein [Brachymonas sp.]